MVEPRTIAEINPGQMSSSLVTTNSNGLLLARKIMSATSIVSTSFCWPAALKIRSGVTEHSGCGHEFLFTKPTTGVNGHDSTRQPLFLGSEHVILRLGPRQRNVCVNSFFGSDSREYARLTLIETL